MTTHSLRRAGAAALASLALVTSLAACGHENDAKADDAAGKTGDAFPVSVLSGSKADGEKVTIDERPHSIVSLSPTATEMLWAMDAGDQVVAVDDQSDYPKDVPVTKLSGYQPNVEAILGYEPDLVVASDDTGDLVAGLEKVKVPTLILPAATTLDDMYDQFERLGVATGHVAEAAKLVADTKQGIEAAVEKAPDVKGMTYYHELDPSLFSATSRTFIGQVYGLFGLENIADGAKKGDDYPQLSDEFVVSAKPDFIFLADGQCCKVDEKQVQGRAGWSQIPAVKDGRVAVIDEDIASRWGPRVVDFAEWLSDTLAEHAPAAH